MEIIFLGTGTSTGVPSMQCLLSGKNCAVCHHAHAVPGSKNRRNNPSLLVRYGGRNVLIDCGKTFRDSILKVFPAKNIVSLDAIVLTHGHADACLGMDDLRELQVFQSTRCAETGEDKKIANEPMYVHCHARTKAEVGPKFDYLMLKPSEAEATIYRWTAKLDWKLFEDLGAFNAAGVAFTALPVAHGKGYVCSGFEFGADVGARFVYLSDLHELPDATRAHLLANPAPIDVLVIDAIYLHDVHGAHLNLPQAIEIAKVLRPKKTYLVGMSHEFDYDAHNSSIHADVLRDANLDVEMAYDGLELVLGQH
ncbi:hypothetical protein SDRG_01009 [Saprolegnia diclina VS20]|uniref:Metallo-beta-lactamase domain-containing protein n=1 Tax=Saprolegnia diclina (strain VS20) TaxID=1156394 RepID=T0QVC4_SAPDV|nr:hypothetical protein SDRG_01009 [Saprolegnia diclina VS20]EQC42169.1 hypothetical protein SDRG_01009 [Saprolegnia diclina VS20]|eukprot:XP_008604738.1 hypothetical protein SDRG_01009 [Saprolegnia diclina VS20]